MTDPSGRSVAAATRLLDARARGALLSLIRIELAAWLVGASGGVPPPLADPAENLHARLASALGAGDQAAAEALLVEHVATQPGATLLYSACSLAGGPMADRLVELAHRFPDAWFNGPMLVRTTRPDRLLALFASPLQRQAVATVGEMVIAGRDDRSPIADAETRWAAIAAEPYFQLSYMREYCDSSIRIKVREDVDEAIDLMQTFEDPDRPGHVRDGAYALLARLVREDAARAAKVVADAESPQDRVIRLHGATWWFELPDVVEPLANDLVKERDPAVKLSLLEILAACRAPSLDRTLAAAEGQPPLEIADALALGAHALRVAHRDDDAERVRNLMLRVFPAEVSAPDRVSPRDLFDVISAPGRPTLAPWGTPPGLPHDCP